MTKGRPTKYTKAVADKICKMLAEGMTLREVCRSDDSLPAESTVREWALEDREGFSAQYTRARQIGYFGMADEVLEISDNGQNDWMERNGEEDEGWQANGEHLQRSRLRVDTRKWLLSKTLPKVFGDKVAIGGDETMAPIKTEETGSGAAKLVRFLDGIAERSGTSGESDA